MHYHLHSLYLFGYMPCNPLTYLVRDARTVKGYKVAIISQFIDKSACYCRRCCYFYRLSLYYYIASYTIAIAFLYTSSLHASIQFSIRFQGIRHQAYIIGRVYPFFDTLPQTFSFYTIALQRHPSFLFSHTTRASYEDEYESNTSFLTRDACRLAKDYRIKLDTGNLELDYQQLAVLDERESQVAQLTALGEAISLGLSQEYTRIEDILGYLVQIGQRSVFLEL